MMIPVSGPTGDTRWAFAYQISAELRAGAELEQDGLNRLDQMVLRFARADATDRGRTVIRMEQPHWNEIEQGPVTVWRAVVWYDGIAEPQNRCQDHVPGHATALPSPGYGT